MQGYLEGGRRVFHSLSYCDVVNHQFRGAPTRVGRVILAVFGAPFVAGGMLLLGMAALGHGVAGERLAMAMGGAVFAAAGCFIWAPAFPGVVNRILSSDIRVVRWLGPALPRIAMGGLVVTMGLVPMLAAVGVIPTDDASWHAPRWVGAVAGGLFVVAGLYILTQGAVERLQPGPKRWVQGLFPLVIISGFAVIASWVAFGPGERQFEGSAGNWLVGVSWGGGDLAGRIAFGAGAVFLVVVALIGWWRYLAGRW